MQNTQRDIIIIGGGLSGLAAAYELEQHNVDYTLIEVKSRLGGSIVTTERDGFIMDGGTFAFAMPAHWPIVDAVGLADPLFSLDVPYQSSEIVAFKHGTETLTRALSARLTGTIITRMAVTSIGTSESGYTVCLENGLALDARGIIVAIPAKFAERVFRTLAPVVSARLATYHYDAITRVAFGYANPPADMNVSNAPPTMLFASLIHTRQPERVPDGGLLVQMGLRVPLEKTSPDTLSDAICQMMNWPVPDVEFFNYWAEADPLTVTGPPEKLEGITDDLPPGVALVGSCYRRLTLPERTLRGREAARLVMKHL